MDGSIQLSVGERKTLLQEVRRGRDPERRLRAHILVLLGDGWAWALIVRMLFTSASTINRWRQRYLYALLAHCPRSLGKHPQALVACDAGLGHYPDDAELLFLSAVLRKDAGDLCGAEAALTQLMTVRPGAHLASVAAGLRGYKARGLLAEVLLQQGLSTEAEAQWRLAVREKPRSAAAWLGLGQVLLAQRRRAEAAEAAARLEGLRGAENDGTALRARIHMARAEFAEAKAQLNRLIAAAPESAYARVLHTHALLQEGKDLEQPRRPAPAAGGGHCFRRRFATSRGRSTRSAGGMSPAGTSRPGVRWRPASAATSAGRPPPTGA